jgi:hypothetical protein
MSKVVALTSTASSGTRKGGRDQLEKAALKLYEAKPTTLGCDLGSAITTLPFQFNPKELTIAKSAKWERKPARKSKKSGPPQFSGAEPSKLTVEMFFDASDSHDGSVVEAVETLLSCCMPTEASQGKDKEYTPLVVFQWGKITGFVSFVTSVSAKYTVFGSDGTPIRATCSVSLEEMPSEHGPQNPTSGTLAARRSHRLVEGDSLASIAYHEYDDPAMWRQLADFNGIDDPHRLRPGTTLLLPALGELIPARPG